MTNIIIALPKPEDARGIKNILVRNGFQVAGVCTTGAQAISQADGLGEGIILCSFKLADMVYSELQECLPYGFELLLLASPRLLSECAGSGVICLAMPFKVNDLLSTLGMMCEGIRRRRRNAKGKPKVRNAEEEADIKAAKELLMARNHMTEEEAHKYLQKCSMDSGTNIVETARMALSMMKH
ncbi:MAG: ANTAR domain-containing protein [Lachnospiraceae bacterium]|mgnify:FL=1|nr:ANTAR domain-containing protein [Lachnospiraceae bacterium]MCI9674495.1 ANTAR domain-containing protein [Lachnospiraceae bacterium]